MVLLTAIAVLSTFFTLVISNVGATVLLVPLVVNMAMAAGADPRMAALVVGLATSNSFVLPTHQVNALYMGPGRYRSIDFVKGGGMMTVIVHRGVDRDAQPGVRHLRPAAEGSETPVLAIAPCSGR